MLCCVPTSDTMHLLILAAMAAVCAARPSFIAVPADQIAFVDLSALHVRRVPRQTLSPPPPQLPQALYREDYQPIPVLQGQQQPLALAQETEVRRVAPVHEQQGDPAGAASQFEARPPDFGEYVDFGAHTGDQGAFGWYADYPIDNQHQGY